jgi:hypothetical protein
MGIHVFVLQKGWCKMIQENYKGIADILKEIRDIVDSPDTDVTWSRYESVEEAIEELDLYITKMDSQEESAIKNIITLFAPTGALQEISINSGWGEEFIEISSRFDELVK